ncbi:MAG: hypothetical protein HYX59_00495 [Elusimicrobia bacterium]|nr:hypothetical protein [Elusimicrobiota bacterium]
MGELDRRSIAGDNCVNPSDSTTHRSFVAGLGEDGEAGIGFPARRSLGEIVIVVCQASPAGGRVTLPNLNFSRAVSDRGGGLCPAASAVSGYGNFLSDRKALNSLPVPILWHNDHSSVIDIKKNAKLVPRLAGGMREVVETK